MSHLELDQLTRAEQLFEAGKLDEALDILNNSSQFEGFDLQQKEKFLYLKGLILTYQNKGEELIILGKQLFEEAQKSNHNPQSFDGLFFVIMGLGILNKPDETFKKIDEAEDLLKLISKTEENILNQREIRLNVVKAWINYLIGNINLAEKYLESPLCVQNELSNSFETVWANMLKVLILVQVKGKYELAMQYTEKAMSLAMKLEFNHYWLGFCQLSVGVIYLFLYETELGLEYHIKSLRIFQKINNVWYIATILNNIGLVYCDKGDYERALKYLQRSLILWEKYPFRLESCIHALIFISLEKGDTELAQKYFQCLENMYNQKKGIHIEIIYKYNKALILKRSTRIRDKAKAEKLFKQVIEAETIYLEVTRDALVCHCDLQLSELLLTNNIEVLEEINLNIAKLLSIAEKSHSYIIYCETFILQAKLALINFDIKAARRFLTQAQKIAESYGIKRLAMKISYEHDKLLKQLDIWERLKESGAPLSERWRLAGLNEQMEKMVKKRREDVPMASDEEPVLLLIVSEGGIPFFSQSFIEDTNFEDHLFGGFFTAINSFINEKFSEGLDRASFGDYTLLMSSIPPFLMCYIYKGQSYSAQNRIKTFLNEIMSEKELWNTFEKFYQKNQKIHIEDFPSLESLIAKTFIEKSNII